MIDWTRVAELRDEIGAEDFGEIVELFLFEVQNAIERLAESAGNAKEVADHMHFLKGAGLNLGFAALSTMCQEGEQAAQGGDADKFTADQVREVFEQSRDCFERDFPVRFAA